MNRKLLETRNRILFVQDATKFAANCENFLVEMTCSLQGGVEQSAEAAALVSDIYLDLQSFLTRWVLARHIAKNDLTEAALDQVRSDLYAFLKKNLSAELLEAVDAEASAIAKSQTCHMSKRTLGGELATVWGHDYCSGLTFSLRRGASFVTSNPAKINLFRKDHPAVWAELVKNIRSEYPDISMERLISRLFVKVVGMSARELRPIFEATGGQLGFACVQVNPRNLQNADKMIEEIEFWHEAFKKELKTDNPNIVFKIPAVPAGIKTVKAVLKQGHRVCLTLNFSVSQHELFADLIEKGSKLGFVVLMSGFLDDAVDKELASLGVADSKQYSRHAAEAVIRKSYANLHAMGCKRTSIMSAAIRGEWTINNSLTADQSAPLYFTTMPEKIKEFDSTERTLKPLVDEPVLEEILTVLEQSRIFREAYYKELLPVDQFEQHVPLINVLNAFNKAYTETEESLK